MNKDERIKYLKNEENLKLINSLNQGLKIAKGKYIARMDADDICLPMRIEKQVAFMESNPDIGISGSQLELNWVSKKVTSITQHSEIDFIPRRPKEK